MTRNEIVGSRRVRRGQWSVQNTRVRRNAVKFYRIHARALYFFLKFLAVSICLQYRLELLTL